MGNSSKRKRKGITIFRQSPAKNNILQKFIKAEVGKQISLIMDCKTKWNSLLLLLEQFNLVKNCKQKALTNIYPIQDNSIDIS